MIIGIDFGTCFSTFAYMIGRIPATGTSVDAQGIPTLFMNLNGQDCFGEQCKTQEAKRHEGDIIKYIKKEIRQNPKKFENTRSFCSGRKNYSGKEIVKKLLSYLIDYAVDQARRSGECGKSELEGISITAPVGIASGQMTATDYNQKMQEIAMELTGLPVNKVRILEEPVAAAIAFLEVEEERNKNQTVLVFDLGGGTLDISAVEHDADNKRYSIIAKDGILDLGGTNWDKALEEYILDKYQDKINKSDFTRDESLRFENQIIDWKMQLSANEYVDGIVRYGDKRVAIEITRRDFEKETESLLDKAIDTLRSVIQEVQTLRKSIDKIVLVGGSCNMPQIKNRIVKEFSAIGTENILLFEPSKAIAKGAAIYAKDQQISSENRTTTDITSFCNMITNTYGFYAKNENLNRRMIYNLLYKGTPFENEESVVARSPIPFTAIQRTQNKIGFSICESKATKREVSKSDYGGSNWMDFDGTDEHNDMELYIFIPEEYHGRATEYRCFPQFEVTQDGILIFTVTDENGKVVGRTQRKKK